MRFLVLILSLVFATGVAGAQVKNEFECVRSGPERILKKRSYPKATFVLDKDKDNRFEKIGYERVRLDRKTKLTIVNYGCENYTLIFRFEINESGQKVGNTRFWYQKLITLMQGLKNGIRSKDASFVDRGTRALSSYVKRNRVVRTQKHIKFGGTEIEEMVSMERVIKKGPNRFIIAASYGVGTL